MIEEILRNVEENKVLVHSITNYVTVNDCANIILASGSSPIMADDSDEVEDITSICSALVINIGTLNKRTVEAMILAGKKSNELGHPVILDPVGAGASEFRNNTTMKLLEEISFSVIRGNISEIKFIAEGSATTKGVDADAADMVTADNLDSVIEFAKKLSKKTGAVIAITGETDIVADSDKAYIIGNGHPMMSNVTGTGCMLTAVIGSYTGANPSKPLEAAATATAAMGLCGELAFERLQQLDAGTNTYRMLLIDFMSKMNREILEGGAKIENR
ncbi:MAG: hydroxyethylthiazole kinase [Proteocatella sp.]